MKALEIFKHFSKIIVVFGNNKTTKEKINKYRERKNKNIVETQPPPKRKSNKKTIERVSERAGYYSYRSKRRGPMLCKVSALYPSMGGRKKKGREG